MHRRACALLALALLLSAPGSSLGPDPRPAVVEKAEAAAQAVLRLADAEGLAEFTTGALGLLGPVPQAAPSPASLALTVQELVVAHARAEATLAPADVVALAARVDALLPLLAALPRPLVAGPCDLLDARPVLCAAGAGAHLHEDEAFILIDLGGQDAYEGRIAGAGPGEVRIVVDIEGRDSYSSLPQMDGAAQGSGDRGVGILWDRAGDDTYACQASGTTAKLACQGGARNEGVGLLWDEAGDDTYLAVVAPAPVAHNATAQRTPDVLLAAQGAAAHDAPVGDLRQALGVLADGGGRDTYAAQAVSGFDVRAPWRTTWQGRTTLAAQGAAVGGAGALADVDGDDTYAALARGNTTRCAVQGAALFIGQGFLADGAGHDSYDARCGQWWVLEPEPGAGALALGGSLNVAQQGSAQYSLVPGITSIPMAALLADLGGDDAYWAQASQVVIANSTVRADARTQIAWHTLQGAGLEGETALLDAGGDDAYTLRVEALALANSPTGRAGAQAREAYVYGQGAGGYGSGALLDLGGSDAYRADGVLDARITGAPLTPPPSGTFVATLHWGVQGAGDQRVQSPDQQGLGLLLDLDGGAPDTVASSPEDPTCEAPPWPKELKLLREEIVALLDQLPLPPLGGARGSALWFDCDPGGVGILA